MAVKSIGCIVLHHCYKVVKKVARIVRTRRGFGVVLDGKCWVIIEFYTFYGVVVEVAMRDGYVWVFGYGFGIDTKTVILARDFAAIGL